MASAVEGNSARVRLEVTLDGRSAAVAAILVLQALWLGIVLQRGWYSGADLANLGAANGQPLTADYLTASLGGHFGAPARLLFWVLNRTAPLDWGLTVVLRLVLQAAATYLLLLLLESLVGRRPWVLAVVALYAFSPVLVPATAVFTNGLGLAEGQVALLGALLAHVRYTRDGGLRWAAGTAVLALVTIVLSDQALLEILLLPVLSLGFLHQGSLLSRLRQAAARWRGWGLLGLAAAAFAAVYTSGDYSSGSSSFTAQEAWDVTRREWVDVLGPTLLGGPWQWVTRPDEWAAYAAPPMALKVLGQVALLVLVVLSVRRTGWRALGAWAIPAVCTTGSAVLIGYGRHDFLGTYISPILRYSYYTPLTLALGATLAFSRTLEAGPRPPAHVRLRSARAALAVVLAASVVSTAGFAARFWDNPSHDYVSAMLDSVRKAGPTVELYDSTVPNGVVPGLEPNHFVSDVLGLAGVPATFGASAPAPLIVNDQGRLVASSFFKVADVTSPTTKGCGTFVNGAGSTTVTLGKPPKPGDWFLQLQLYEPRANTVTIEVRDAAGEVLPLAGGSATVRPTATLVAVNRRIAFGAPATVTLSSPDTKTNLCLVHALVGAPFPLNH